MPNFGVNCYRGFGQQIEGLLQKSSNLSVKVHLYLVAHGICCLSDLESLVFDLMVFDLLLKVLMEGIVFLILIKRCQKKLLLHHLQEWVRVEMFESSNFCIEMRS